jgi:serine/threonine protein kinase
MQEPFLNKNIKGYVLMQWLGSGGMGEVYQAQHKATRQLAAVKVLNRIDQVERFRNEAYVQASVKHPNIAALYEYSIENGLPCIVMEYVEGLTLERLIKRQGALPENFVWKVFEQIVSAVTHLHENGIFHRDLKPANIKITKESVAKLLDFGIAKAAYTPKLTQEGYIVGTSYYMAPEQFSGKGNVTSDCWALGVMLYEMLTGYLPFDGKTDTEIRVKIERCEYIAPNLIVPTISKKSKRLIEKLLQPNPQKRFSSVALLHELRGESSEGLVDKITNWVKGFK